MLQEDISKVNFRHLKGLQERKHESKLADEVRCFERENEKKTHLLQLTTLSFK